jgi:hypothetical protein
MAAARARTEGGFRPFRPDEYASMRTVAGYRSRTKR